MEQQPTQNYSAFEATNLLAQGSLDEVLVSVQKRMKKHPEARILIFSDQTGKEMDFDLSGSEQDLRERLKIYLEPMPQTSSGPGRPKLGVMAREISLLPRHWEWLSNQSGGASATLRKLVEAEIKKSGTQISAKQLQERTYKFLSSIAGDLPDYEEALRALFAKDKTKFKDMMSSWPTDIRSHAFELAGPLFE